MIPNILSKVMCELNGGLYGREKLCGDICNGRPCRNNSAEAVNICIRQSESAEMLPNILGVIMCELDGGPHSEGKNTLAETAKRVGVDQLTYISCINKLNYVHRVS